MCRSSSRDGDRSETMSAKQIDVTCPCCSSRLTVDVLTGRTMRAEPPGQAGGGASSVERWASAQEKVRERTQSGQDKLESALERERTKETRFDEMFKKATEKHSRRKDADDP